MKVKAKKSLGQHFLQDQSICDAIVASSPNIKGKVVVEIGPGYGALTDSILKKNPAKIILIEKDELLYTHLKNKYRELDNIILIKADALNVNLSDFLSSKSIVISNLPYNIASRLICNWLSGKDKKVIEHLTLMMQKEVVQRICARPNSKNYGRLSIVCQLTSFVEKSFDIPKEAFDPIPKVTSSILQSKPYDLEICPKDFKAFERILQMCFSKRRKMLKSILGIKEEDFQNLDILQTCRPEDLVPKDFLRIARYMTGLYSN